MTSRRLGEFLAVAAAMLVLLPVLTSGLSGHCRASPNAVMVINSESLAVYVDRDGSADFRYDILLTVRPQSSIVTDLTIHLPNWQFNANDVTATLGNRTLLDLKKTSKEENDLFIFLGPTVALQPGVSYSLTVLVHMGAMVVKGPSGNARISVTPTWWDPNEVQEIQALSLTLNLPEGLLDRTAVQYTDGAAVFERASRLVLTWNRTFIQPNQKQVFHADFPASAVSKVYDQFWDIQFHFYQAYVYIAVIVIIIVVVALSVRRGFRKPYIKPYLNFEGWGVREGLGPMEAAILMRLGDERVACMYLLDLAMVDAIEVKDPEKMLVEIKNPEHAGRSSQMLSCIRNGRLDPIAATNLLGRLKDDVAGRVEGHDMEGTRAHYATTTSSTWSRIRKSKSPSVDDLLWLMTDPKAEDRFAKAKFEGVPDWGSWKVVL